MCNLHKLQRNAEQITTITLFFREVENTTWVLFSYGHYLVYNSKSTATKDCLFEGTSINSLCAPSSQYSENIDIFFSLDEYCVCPCDNSYCFHCYIAMLFLSCQTAFCLHLWISSQSHHMCTQNTICMCVHITKLQQIVVEINLSRFSFFWRLPIAQLHTFTSHSFFISVQEFN